MFSTVYVSNATVEFSDTDVAQLLATSRRNNAARDITGLLLFEEGQFMQALEGPEDAVRSLTATITEDPRHAGLWTLSEETADARQFPEWTMGYRELTDDGVRAIPGYDRFLESSSDPSLAFATRSRALWLLDWFRLHRA